MKYRQPALEVSRSGQSEGYSRVGLTHMDTFLSPIEKPNGLMMKLAYYFTRRQFGKVLTPLKVHNARLPIRHPPKEVYRALPEVARQNASTAR